MNGLTKLAANFYGTISISMLLSMVLFLGISVYKGTNGFHTQKAPVTCARR